MSLTKFRLAAVCGLACMISQAAQGGVIISEIMYNPDSSEGTFNTVEWVEIYNSGGASEDIGGWTIQDEDGTSADTIPAATMIAPGEAVVLFASGGTLADFQAAWGSGYQAIPISFDGLFGLSNGPSATSEILELIDDSLNSVDVANYDDSGDWPSDSPDGPSIYVLPGGLDATSNDDGTNWARSTAGVDGAINNAVAGFFTGEDTGSPGFVNAIPEPSSLLLCVAGLLGIAARRK